MMLPHLATRLYGTPLLIARPKLEVILTVLGSRIGLQHDEIALAAAKPKPPATHEGRPGLAVIPIHGTLVHRTLGLEPASGFTSYTEISEQLAAALENPKVDGILLDVDSPGGGGEAAGVFELAQRIRAASSIKPVWAHANDCAFSAAYAIAAGASRVTLSRTAGVGSIGVIALHIDQSLKDAKDGLTYTAVFAGHHKNDFNPHAPLTPEAAGTLQREVDRLCGIFVREVAALRGLPEESIRATEAGIFFGEDAVAAGLADAVVSFDGVLTEFAVALSARPRVMGLSSPSTRVISAPPPLSTLTMEFPMNENEHDQAHDPLRGETTAEDQEDPHGVPDATPPDTGDSADKPEQVSAATPQVALFASTSSTSDQGPSAAHADLQAAVAQVRTEALAIAELCQLAGQPGRIVEFLAEGASPAQVRRALLAQRADQPKIDSRITSEAGTVMRPDQSPVVAAVKKLHAQE